MEKRRQKVNQASTTIKPIYLTKKEFDIKVVDTNKDTWKYLGNKPAIIDFYANWCGSCRLIAPSLEKFAAEYSEEIYIYKVDTDKEQALAHKFVITSIPNLLFIPMKEETQMVSGTLPKIMIERKIKNNTSKITTILEGLVNTCRTRFFSSARQRHGVFQHLSNQM